MSGRRGTERQPKGNASDFHREMAPRGIGTIHSDTKSSAEGEGRSILRGKHDPEKKSRMRALTFSYIEVIPPFQRFFKGSLHCIGDEEGVRECGRALLVGW